MTRQRTRSLALLLIGGALCPPTPCRGAAPDSPPAGADPGAGGAAVVTTTEPLSLAEAIARARAASPRLAQLRSLHDASTAGLRGARADRRPLVDLSASYTRASDVPELSVDFPPPEGRVTIFPNIPDNFAGRIGVAVPLYTGGRLSQQVTAAARDDDAAAGDIASGTADLVLETSTVYWGLVTARESERVFTEAVASYEAHLTDARERARLGLAAPDEVLAVQVDRDQAELRRLQAHNLAALEHAGLVRLLGLPPDARVEPGEPLQPVPAPREEAETLVAAALASRPERAALVARIDAAEARARAARADRLPQAHLAAGYDYADPNRRILPVQDGWQDTWDASVNLSFRLLDGGRAAAAEAQRSAQARALRHQLEDLDRRIRLEVTQRLLDLGTATATVPVAERNLEAARESRRVSAERYRAGVIRSSELLDAEVALLRAGLDRTEALAQQRLAIAALDRAVGR